MKRHLAYSVLSSASIYDEQTCSLKNFDDKVVQSFVTGERFQFDQTFSNQNQSQAFGQKVLKPAVEKFLAGTNSTISIVTNLI